MQSADSALHALAGELPHLLLPALHVVLHLHGRIDVRRRVEVGVHQHRHDADEDAVNSKDRTPTLVGSLLLVEAVRAWRVEDGDAHAPIWVDVGVPHFCFKPHLRGVIREVAREGQDGREDAALEEAVGRTLEDDAPLEEVRVVLQSHREAAVIRLHELYEFALQELARHMRHRSEDRKAGVGGRQVRGTVGEVRAMGGSVLRSGSAGA
mmetsp:Transcript_41407/g.104021  ORF Transcript_41407/g.104021 Transcript_41407/m.104021 type:complete len:209 (-) Transcript_41407:7-633(-)